MKRTATWAFGFATFIILVAWMLGALGAISEDELGRQHPLPNILHAITMRGLLYPGKAAVSAFVIPLLPPSAPFSSVLAFLVFWTVNCVWLFAFCFIAAYSGRKIVEKRARRS